jgi:hypothetical protein
MSNRDGVIDLIRIPLIFFFISGEVGIRVSKEG